MRASRMIGSSLQVGVKRFTACGPDTPALRFGSHKNRIDFHQTGGILKLEYPTVLFLIIHIKDSQAAGRALGRPASSPSLVGSIAPSGAPLTQIKGIKDQ